ncbi:alpha-1,2-fucosyltransferase [Candidatus Xianfuyuplasma coldseepsis]|uniref:Alpha-1,2-fucosyltransferase n=1 Tax=Candidatus Xianfuyuplasma coldseepsis TaxID=2782163 RepID=A0A7L7KQ14_9MOLU|nr:alpha-1,2-fucosyltransferase [Xianfuyuplasma coldseepsis]QMS84529.1 hypothetical protein G4Z02_01795 [Xianfuyuplasma coldseepsis]
MKIIVFKGGFGNQLFQYCFYLYLKNETSDEIIPDFSFYSKNYGISKRDPIIKQIDSDLDKEYSLTSERRLIHPTHSNKLNIGIKLILRLLCNKIYFERFSIIDINYKKYYIFEGYFQNLKYVESVKNKIEEKIANSKISNDVYQLTKKYDPEKYALICVRLGDYKKIANNRLFGNISNSYYRNSIDKLIDYQADLKFIIISSNPIEAKKMLGDNDNLVLLPELNMLNEINTIEFMRHFKYYIIPNSTFHWWGAYLSHFNEDSRVCIPSKWYANHKKAYIYPEHWIKIERGKNDE